jgi:hypothetical protein
LFILTSSLYAFAAANSVPESGAGDGSGTVSGYTVTNVSWAVDPSDRDEVDDVSFDVAPTGGAGAADEVYASIDAGSNWVTCTGPVGSTWTCLFAPNTLISGVTSLQVVAVEAP